MVLTEKNLNTLRKMSLCHIVHHQSHKDWHGIEPSPPTSEVKFRIVDLSLVFNRVL